MSQIFGQFLEEFIPSHDCLQIIFTPHADPIKKRWRNNRLSAHFIADYFTSFLPIDVDDPERQKKIAIGKNSVGFIANELLENAIKYNDERAKYQIQVGVNFVDNFGMKAIIFAKNSIRPETVESFQALIQELLSCDLDARYISEIENSVINPNHEVSGLGLLTIINDYSAQMGWKFETVQEDPQIITVTTMAQVVV